MNIKNDWEAKLESVYSFMLKYSKITVCRSYFIGQIVRDWKWDHRVRRLVTVNGLMDLNLSPMCRQPGENRNHKTLCCFCCTSGPISAVIHTNRCA